MQRHFVKSAFLFREEGSPSHCMSLALVWDEGMSLRHRTSHLQCCFHGKLSAKDDINAGVSKHLPKKQRMNLASLQTSSDMLHVLSSGKLRGKDPKLVSR